MARTPGSLNKSTEQVRRAVAELLQMSAPRMMGWLEVVAKGQMSEAVYDEKGNMVIKPEWTVKPDPGKAVDLVLKAAEYHIPKLARVEGHVAVEEKSHEEWLNGLE